MISNLTNELAQARIAEFRAQAERQRTVSEARRAGRPSESERVRGHSRGLIRRVLALR